MSASSNLSSLAEYFVRTYNLPERQALAIKKTPTLRMMNMESKRLGSGDAFYTTLRTHNGYAGISHDFGASMTNGVSSKGDRFLISGPKSLYGRVTVDALTLAQSSLGALIELKGAEMDEQADMLLTRIEQKLWGDTVGSIGRLSGSYTDGATATMTLLTTDDIYNFEYGMILAFNSAATGVVASAKANVYRVTGVDYLNGTLSVTRISSGFKVAGVAAGSGAAAASDYIWVDGDTPAQGGDADRSIPGIPSFIPSTDPSTSFLGVDRTGRGPLLSGWRFTFQGSIEETVKYAFSKMGRFVNRSKARYSVCLSAGDWFKLEQELGARVVRDPEADKKFGTSTIGVLTPFGLVSCITIPVLRDGRAYIIDWSSWTFHHLKALPHVVQDDGQVWLRLAPGATGSGSAAYPGVSGYDSLNGDGVEARLRAWFHPMCHSPMSNATFPTA